MTSTNYGLLGLIPLLPALGALVNGLLGSKLPKKVVHTIACGTIFGSFIVTALAFRALASNHEIEALSYVAYKWFSAGGLNIDIAFQFDHLTAVMCLIVSGVGFLIHVYSIGYMSHDPSYSRYFTYLNLFCFAMLLLVMGQNLVMLFVGWEGVGLASYLLIGFWFTDEAKASAGKKAFIVNRIGDAAFLLGMFILFYFAGSLDIPEVQRWVGGLGHHAGSFAPWATVICILFFIGCCGKSAQIPLYTWLPDAMAGPTPVSALIHAATMVTAGVYLVTRLNFLYVMSPTAMGVVATVGALTALFAASIAVVQNDIKKVLAYSTVSQLGYMFLACGVGSFYAGTFHLATHAFFKALLFLGAGSVIHAMSGKQDIQEMGGLKKWMPITRFTFLIACLAIAGFPLFSGFFSKDEILWYALANRFPGQEGLALGPFLWVIGVITAGLTAFYMFRLYFLTFEGESRADEKTKSHIHESPPSMTVPLLVLAVLSVIAGFIGIPHIFHMPEVLHHWLEPVLASSLHVFHGNEAYGDGAAWAAMGIATAVGLGGIFVAWKLYGGESTEKAASYKERFAGAHKLLMNKYYVDEIYDHTVVRPLMGTARMLYAAVDRVLIDTLLVGGIAFVSRSAGQIVRQLQNGDVQRYAFFIVFGLSLVLLMLSGI